MGNLYPYNNYEDTDDFKLVYLDFLSVLKENECITHIDLDQDQPLLDAINKNIPSEILKDTYIHLVQFLNEYDATGHPIHRCVYNREAIKEFSRLLYTYQTIVLSLLDAEIIKTIRIPSCPQHHSIYRKEFRTVEFMSQPLITIPCINIIMDKYKNSLMKAVTATIHITNTSTALPAYIIVGTTNYGVFHIEFGTDFWRAARIFEKIKLAKKIDPDFLCKAGIHSIKSF